jgi:hypothetical protein
MIINDVIAESPLSRIAQEAWGAGVGFVSGARVVRRYMMDEMRSESPPHGKSILHKAPTASSVLRSTLSLSGFPILRGLAAADIRITK